jgi:hypothetical protein
VQREFDLVDRLVAFRFAEIRAALCVGHARHVNIDYLRYITYIVAKCRAVQAASPCIAPGRWLKDSSTAPTWGGLAWRGLLVLPPRGDETHACGVAP